MYNLIFGQNEYAGVILATLGLKRDDVGRFRDCYVAGDRIVVYTRNGGDNRKCWCEQGLTGTEQCKHHKETRQRKKMVETPYKSGGGSFIRSLNEWEDYETLICDAPDSEECHCIGCTMRFHIPKHPMYEKDVDDDYDNTYATIYYKIPEQWKGFLAEMNTGDWNPAERWQQALKTIETGEVPEALRVVMGEVMESLKGN